MVGHGVIIAAAYALLDDSRVVKGTRKYRTCSPKRRKAFRP
jgi:hypothetical protein